MAHGTDPGGAAESTRRAACNGEIVTALVEWAVSRGWTTRTDPSGCCHFYDPHGAYIAYWPSTTSSNTGHRW